MRHIILAAALVLLGAAYGSGDYELRTPDESIKAKSESACHDAQQAIARGWIKSISPSTPTQCNPHPNYFTPEENCIQGYNCP